MLEKLKSIGFIILLGAICTSFLVGINSYTEPLINRNQALKLKKKVLEAYSIEYSLQNIEEMYSGSVTSKSVGDQLFYISKAGEIAFTIEGPGVWGPIRAVLAMKNDRQTIHGISIVHQEETPGLGGRIAEAEFLASFKGRRVSPALKITPPGKANAENEVDGITGATMSIAAFEGLINKSVKTLEHYEKP